MKFNPTATLSTILSTIRTGITQTWEDPINTAFAVGWKVLSIAIAFGILMLFLAITSKYVTYMVTLLPPTPHTGN